jgi:hypothetical protein
MDSPLTTPNNTAVDQDADHTASNAQRRARNHAHATSAQRREPGRAQRGHHRQEATQLALPGMDEWVQEQLKRAPARSREWARRVAAIYGLELPEN